MNRIALKEKLCLKCSNCSKLFRDPIELPCKHNVCREHLTEKEALKQNNIKCFKCKEEFVVKGNKFKSNESKIQLLSDQMFINEEMLKFQHEIEQNLKDFLFQKNPNKTKLKIPF